VKIEMIGPVLGQIRDLRGKLEADTRA